MDPKLLAFAMQQGGGTTPELLDLLARDGGLPDDRRRMIEAMMEMQQPGGADPDDGDDIADPDPGDAATREVERLRHLVDDAARQLDMLEDLAVSFASAVGACGDCFGADAGCDTCHGEGAPGWRPPDRAAFRFFVQPVLDRRRRPRDDAAPFKHRAGPAPTETSTERSSHR